MKAWTAHVVLPDDEMAVPQDPLVLGGAAMSDGFALLGLEPWHGGARALYKIRLTVGAAYANFQRMVRVESLPPLGVLEIEVLEHLWDVGEADVTETHRSVGRKRSNSVNTVGSALERLHRKGLVRRSKVSHAYRYRAAIEREAFQARRMVDAVGGAEALADLGVLTAFIDAVAETDRSSLDQLSALIAERKAKKR